MRLFVSSPSDVAPERARVEVVAARLNGEYEGLEQIEVIRWETGFYTADRPFQQAISDAVRAEHWCASMIGAPHGTARPRRGRLCRT
jgi:hypothetical protein